MLAPDGAAHFRLVRDAEAGHAGRPLIPQGNIEVGRQDAGPSFKHVSRVQARLHQDGATVRLESVGGHPTGMWGGPGTSWRWIPKGESCNLEAGAHVALDRKLTAGSVFTLVRDDTPTTSEAPSQPQDQTPSQPPSASWEWACDGTWREYSPQLRAELEAGRQRGDARVPIDAERYVDLDAMRQVRVDDPSRYRRVRRGGGDASSGDAAGSVPAPRTRSPPTTSPHADRPTKRRRDGADASASAPAALTPAEASFGPEPASSAPASAPALSAPAPASAPLVVDLSDSADANAESDAPSPGIVHADGPVPLRPSEVPAPTDATWFDKRGALLIRRANEEPRSRVAAFDLDGTLLRWPAGSTWAPSKLSDYVLWSERVVAIIRELHRDGAKVVIFSNQGTIKGALTGKTAAKIRGLVDWLANTLRVPLHALVATKKDEHRKPAAGMWSAMEEYTNGGVAVALETSFYVGDMAGRPGDPGDSDLGFARAVGSARGGTLEFQTPEAAFGPAAAGAGGPLTGAAPGAPTGSSPSAPPRALLARAALHGGYARGPLMLILVGAQGAGKSFFSAALASAGGGAWAIACQDTTGNREKVERNAAQALRSGRSVVVDRTHLDAAQRAHFLRVARDCEARAHALYFRRPLPLLLARVAGRVGHPGGVEGEEKAPVVRFAFGKLSPPDYAEGFELISTASSDVSAATWCDAYARVGHATAHPPATAAAAPDAAPGDGVAAPIGRLALGTMKLGKRGMSALRGSGFEWVDTAPTYKNEAHLLSQGLLGDGVKVIVKVPRRASDGKGAAEAATAVRAELSDSLAKLGRARAELLMLHWPIGDATTMRAVWGAMEEAVHAGRATALGVSNFGARALAELLGSCSVAPVVLQVERHPLLPQWDLLDFCSRRGIAMQAHTPLGGEKGEACLRGHPTVVHVAEESGMSVAQVLVQWNVRHGVGVVAKCSSAAHAAELLDAARTHAPRQLSVAQMEVLDMISPPGEGRETRFLGGVRKVPWMPEWQ